MRDEKKIRPSREAIIILLVKPHPFIKSVYKDLS